MKQEKFKVIDYIRLLIKSISVNLDSFPKKEYEIKKRIKKNSYDMLELAYEANNTEFVELKIHLINKLLAKIKLVDYFFGGHTPEYIELKVHLFLGSVSQFCIKY